MFELILLCVSLILGYVYFREARPKNFPPGPTPLPILGNLHQLGLEPYKTFSKLRQKYGGIFSIDYGSYRSIVINDLKLIKKCLNDVDFSGRPKFPLFLVQNGVHAKYCRGVAGSDGQVWSEQRRFYLKNLRNFGLDKTSMEGIIQEEIQECIENVRKMAGKPIQNTGLFNAAVANSLWRICTGERTPQNDPKLQRILQAIITALQKTTPVLLFFPFLGKWFPNLSGYNDAIKHSQMLPGFIYESYEAHKQTIIKGQPRDLMDVAIDEVNATTDTNSSFYMDEGVANLIKSFDDLFVAGSETTSTTLNWLLLCLALFPNEQQKLIAEIDSIVGRSKIPEIADRQRMHYTECLIMEVLRFTSIFPMALPHRITKDVELDGHVIPKDTLFTPNLYAVHHDQEIYGDPENFRPERFLLADGSANRTHVAFLPFSYGKRACIGEKLAKDQLFLFTTSLFQQFGVSTDPNSPTPTLDPAIGIVLAPKPHKLILSERT